MLYSLLLLLLLAHCSICSTASFQPDSVSRLHWVGPKLRLALRQAKRSLVSTPMKLYIPGEAWNPATRSDDVEASEVDAISSDYVNYGNYVNYNQLERVGEEAEQVAQMIKSFQQAIQAKQMKQAIQAQQAIQAKQMMEPKLKRPKIDGRIRILKVGILCILLYFRCSNVPPPSHISKVFLFREQPLVRRWTEESGF